MFSAPNKAIKPISRAAIVEIDRSLGYEVGFITRGASGQSSCRDFANKHVIPDRLCETCSNLCALVAILSLAYLVLVRVLTCLLSTKKIRNVITIIIIIIIRDLKQTRTATAVNKQLNFTVKNKPYTTNYIYCK